MDLNQTTTISRRKTFTVPVPAPPPPPVGAKLMEASSSCNQKNQTFIAGELGVADQTINIPKPSSSKALINNRAATGGTEDMASSSKKSILEGDGQLWKLTEVGLLQNESINDCFRRLVNHRNSRFPKFEAKKGTDVSGKAEEQPDAALDTELERLRQLERNLKDDVNKAKSAVKLLEERSKADEEKNRAKIKDLQRKVQQNKNLRTEITAKNEELKDQIRNVTLMTKDLVDRLNYPKAIIKTSLKVSGENRCQDEDFCREFSGGKCIAVTNMENKNTSK